MNVKHKPCLVLNLDYTPISIIDWKTAINWCFKASCQKKPVIDIVSYYKQDKIRGCSKLYDIPSIIKINMYVNINRHKVKFSRKNLFLRDNNTCQYCGKQCNIQKLTYDHVIPKSKWGLAKSATSWDNIVTACNLCNRKKADKTPEQANMRLLSRPKQPSFSYKFLPWYQIVSTIGYVSEWSDFLPVEYQNENR